MSRARDNANLGAQAGSGLTASDITTGTLGNTVQDNITRVGTVGTGTWEGTTVAVNKGGTGVTTSTGTGNTVLSASPTFTGSPITVTASAPTNSVQIASTAFVHTAVANLVDSPTFTGTVAIPNVANLETAVVANTAKVTNSTNASDLASGTLNNSRLPSTISVASLAATANLTTDTIISTTIGTCATSAGATTSNFVTLPDFEAGFNGDAAEDNGPMWLVMMAGWDYFTSCTVFITCETTGVLVHEQSGTNMVLSCNSSGQLSMLNEFGGGGTSRVMYTIFKLRSTITY